LIIILSLITFFPQETELFEDDLTLPKVYIAPEIFYDLLNNPLDINSADYEDFLQVPYISPILANMIIDYRKTNGDFNKVDDLLSIKDLDEELLDRVRPFLTVKRKPINKSAEIRIRAVSDSFDFNHELKDWSINNRIKANYGKFGLVLLNDKDFFETNLLDFYGLSLSYSDQREQLIIGDYLLGFGNGLLFSKPFYNYLAAKSFGGFEPKELSSLTSPIENNALFGLAYKQILGEFSLSSYLSSYRLDAEIDSNGIVKKIDYTGRHTDSTSIANKDKLREDLIGARFCRKIASWRVGVSCYHTRYNHPFAPEDSTNSFYGNQLTLLGIDGSGIIGNYYLTTELAYSLGFGFGFVCGILGDWKPLRVSLNLTDNQKDFYSPHGSSYSLANKKDNLSGNFNLSYDFYHFRFLIFGSTKTDFIVDSLPAKIETGIERKEGKLKIGLIYKRTLKDDVGKTQGTKLDLSYDFFKNFTIGFRLEDRQSLTKTGRGILFRFSGDLSYHNFDYTGRIYWFEVTSSDSRIFAYEPFFSGLGGNEAFSDKGIRHYSFIAYNTKLVKTGLKIGITKKDKTSLDLGIQIEVHL
jgi:hypothetical protein